MKKILSVAIAVAFLTVAAKAFAADAQPSGNTSTTSEKDLQKIHTSPAKKTTPPTTTSAQPSNMSEKDLEKIHTSPAKKDAPAPAPAK